MYWWNEINDEILLPAYDYTISLNFEIYFLELSSHRNWFWCTEFPSTIYIFSFQKIQKGLYYMQFFVH